MKAAVLHQLGTSPKFEEFAAPQPSNEREVVVNVKAAAIKQVDKSKASGKHYTNYPQLPVVVGIDGAGLLEDGTRIYAWGVTGMMAEQALVHKGRWAVIPDNLDIAVAAALPNALVGSDMALLYRAKMDKGQTILINGATGVTGKIAVQMAKNRGAAKVIVTGRNEEILEELKSLGADETINLKQEDDTIIQQLTDSYNNQPFDIVLDYLWGHPMELILRTLKDFTPRQIKIVTVGEMAGAQINIPSGLLRSTKIELLGSGIGSISREELAEYMKDTLPAILRLAAEGLLTMDIETVPLADIESTWTKPETPGSRFVITM
jgi:NADPH:quinone reductase-like Zn-dependent oxidoreductase